MALLTVAQGGQQTPTAFTVYGIMNDLEPEWQETGEGHLNWDAAPCRNGISGQKYLGRLSFDNTKDRLKTSPMLSVLQVVNLTTLFAMRTASLSHSFAYRTPTPTGQRGSNPKKDNLTSLLRLQSDICKPILNLQIARMKRKTRQ